MASSLLALPTELLQMVLRALVPEPLSIDSTRQLSTDFRQRRRSLWSLCLTSRHLNATGYLYRNIALTEPVQFLYLFRSLLANRDLRSHIREFACFADISRQSSARVQFSKVWNYNLPYFQSVILDPNDAEILEAMDVELLPMDIESALDDACNNHWCDDDCWRSIVADLPSIVAGIALCFMSHLESLLLLLVSTGGYEQLGILDHGLSMGIKPDPHRSRPAHLFSSVKTVKLLCKAESFRSVWHPDTGSGTVISPAAVPHWQFCHTSRVELLADNGNWPCFPREFPLDFSSYSGLDRFHLLKDLRLYESKTCPATLGRVLKAATGLETFHYTTRHQEWNSSYSFLPDEYEWSMNEALAIAKSRLHELNLGSVTRKKFLGPEEYTELERINVLPSYTSLKRLSIDLRWLIPLSSSETLYAPIMGLLPESLVELTLRETWESTVHQNTTSKRCNNVAHASWIWAALAGFIFDVQDNKLHEKLPKLRRLVFQASNPEHDLGVAVETRDGHPGLPTTHVERVADLVNRFKKNGVEFIWEVSDQNMRASEGTCS